MRVDCVEKGTRVEKVGKRQSGNYKREIIEILNKIMGVGRETYRNGFDCRGNKSEIIC